MSKANQVPLRVIYEGGRLVPASAYDQERLSEYQNGAVLEITLWQGRNTRLLRKFYAILGKVVDDCPTPWKSKDEAADAIKMACGLTDYGKSVNGQFFIRPGSISFANMDEAAFQKFFDLAMGVLHKLTGVDPLTLGKEADDTGPEPNNLKAPETRSETNDEGDGAHEDAPTVGDYDTKDMSEFRDLGIASQFAAEVAEKVADEKTADEKAAFQVETDKVWLQGVTKMLWAATNPGGGEEGMELLATQKRMSREGYPADNITKTARDKATSIYKACQVIVDAGEYGDNLKYVEGLSGLKLEPKKKGK